MQDSKTILIVDDDDDILVAGELLLKRHFGQVVTCNQPSDIPRVMAAHSFDAIMLDMNFSPGERSGEQGFNWLKRILQLDPEAIVVMITAHGNADIAVEAIKHGATDFINKPWQNQKVIATLSAAVQLHQSRDETNRLKRSNQLLVEASTVNQQTLLGESMAMAEVHSLIRRAAPTEANVLILGENGTGKELVARELHRQSLRADNIFMSVDLGAIAENLFESEMFGHKKGAFTGASENRVGRLVAANGGTLFLDEIGNIPLHLQAKLLTVLEQRKVTPLGSNQSIDIDVRVLAATNVGRDTLIDEQKFRQDLLFRLNTVEITIPPMRDRQEDIPEIAIYYAHYYSRKYRKPEKRFTDQAMQAAIHYQWPGNVRALRHCIERAVILSESEEFQLTDLQLPNHVNQGQTSNNSTHLPDSAHQINQNQSTNGDQPVLLADDLNLEKMEKLFIEKALRQYPGNISKAAEALGITRATLYRRIEKYGF